jgi:hypothetical protein
MGAAVKEHSLEGVRGIKKVGKHWSRQCGILDITHPYRLLWPVTGIVM